MFDFRRGGDAIELTEIRERIDRVDREILRLFQERMDLAEAAGAYKQAHHLPIQDRARERAILSALTEAAGDRAPYVRRLFSTLMELSRARQMELISSPAPADAQIRTDTQARTDVQGREDAQGRPAKSDIFSGTEQASAHLRRDQTNLVLIGMPGCGKTTIGRLLSRISGREAVDVDEEIVRRTGREIPEIFAEDGEAAFRAIERTVTAEAGGRTGIILITGGGVVKDPRNDAPLRRNGRIYHLIRDLSLLPREGRPLSRNADLAAMWEERQPMYRRLRDAVISNDTDPETVAETVWRDFCAYFDSKQSNNDKQSNNNQQSTVQ